MLVELELIVQQLVKVVLVLTQIQWKITVIMLLIVISRRKVKLLEPVISQALQLLLLVHQVFFQVLFLVWICKFTFFFRDCEHTSVVLVNFVVQLLLLLDVFFLQVAGMWIFTSILCVISRSCFFIFEFNVLIVRYRLFVQLILNAINEPVPVFLNFLVFGIVQRFLIMKVWKRGDCLVCTFINKVSYS